MTHGDMHPGNAIWDPSKSKLVLIDFEMMGLGSGPTDLAIWIAVRSSPAWRRKYEKEFVELYYETLISWGEKSGKLSRESYTLEQCWYQYKFDGAAKLLMYFLLLPVLSNDHFTKDMEVGLKAFL